MPAGKRHHGPRQTDAQIHFVDAAQSLTKLYKLAHLGQARVNASADVREEVRRFANRAAVELPALPERHRGRRFIALDELLAFLDHEDLADTHVALPHTFGNKRGHDDATVAVPPAADAVDSAHPYPSASSRLPTVADHRATVESATRRHRMQEPEYRP
jgi:hypothetical protein